MSASQSAVNLPHSDIWKRELVKLISKQSKNAKPAKKPGQRGLELAGVYQHTRSQLTLRKSSIKKEQKDIARKTSNARNEVNSMFG